MPLLGVLRYDLRIKPEGFRSPSSATGAKSSGQDMGLFAQREKHVHGPEQTTLADRAPVKPRKTLD